MFFSTEGLVYKVKAWKIPEGSSSSKGKSLFNILPLKSHQAISSIMPMPEDETDSKNYQIIFATALGKVRKNSLEDFSSINAAGKIAMKLDNNNAIVGVKLCSDEDDILLSTKHGKCIRTPVSKLRTTKSRSSVGVRGIRLTKDDKIISISVISHTDVSSAEAKAYLKMISKEKGMQEETESDDNDTDNSVSDIEISKDRYDELKAREQFILTVTENGFGKRSSSYQFRVSNRGGSGIMCIATSDRNGDVLASFPVNNDDDIMLITKTGQLIRCPVKDVRVAGRNTQGVSIFKTTKEEKVVSASRVELDS